MDTIKSIVVDIVENVDHGCQHLHLDEHTFTLEGGVMCSNDDTPVWIIKVEANGQSESWIKKLKSIAIYVGASIHVENGENMKNILKNERFVHWKDEEDDMGWWWIY